LGVRCKSMDRALPVLHVGSSLTTLCFNCALKRNDLECSNDGGGMPLIGLVARLQYISGEARLGQCPCEPAYDPPLDIVLAVSSSTMSDRQAATIFLQGLGYAGGACVAVDGTLATIGVDISAFYLDPNTQCITPCPNGQCDR